MAKTHSKSSITIKGGGLFGSSSNSFGGVIKKTKTSEASLIKNYESMEQATKDYNKSFKEHLSNLNKLDDYANFSGMKNLFQKVIMKDVITQGAKVDTSMSLLFRNYHIEKEPTPSAFRREHILNQVKYILETSFAGREHMLIKYMSVEIGKSQFILHITTIENIKKSRTLDHNGYVIDAGGTRAALKDILGTTKKNLRRRTALVEIGRGSNVGQSSRRKRTKKSSGVDSISTLLKSKKTSGKSGKYRSHSGIANENNSSMGDIDIGNSKESIKSFARKKREPSNKLASMIDLKSMQLSKKQSKPSIYKRPSEKRPAVVPGIITSPAGTSPTGMAPPGALPPTQLTTDLAGKKQDILGGPAPALPPYQAQQALPPYQAQQALPPYQAQQALPPYQAQQALPPYQAQQAPQAYQAQPPKPKIIYCKEHTDPGSCAADTSCYWNANYQSCNYKKPRNARGPGAAQQQDSPSAIQNPFGTAQPDTAPVAQPPPPMMDAI